MAERLQPTRAGLFQELPSGRVAYYRGDQVVRLTETVLALPDLVLLGT